MVLKKFRSTALASLLAGLLGVVSLPAYGWPDKPIEIVVPYSAGGAVDVMTRLVAKEMSEHLGQPIVILQRPGGEGNIAATAVLDSKPDGYTLLSSSPVITSIPVLMDTDWKTDDFAPVGRFATSSGFIVSSAKLPVKSIPELIEHVRAEPGLPSAVLFGGAYTTFVTRSLAKEAEIDLLFIPYQGAAQHMVDLYEGRVGLATVSGSVACGTINDDKVNVLAITGEDRFDRVPDVPTMIELGYPNVNAQGWYGLHAPKGVPEDRVAILSEALEKAISNPELKAKLEETCISVSYMGPEDLDKFVAEDIERWKVAAELLEGDELEEKQ